MVSAQELAQRKRTSQAAVGLGLAANLVLAVAKTAAGIAGRSSALVSDGINSVSDTVYYLVVAAFVRQAAKPPDREHPYGHTQLETIASLIVGAFVLTTAVAIFWNQANALFDLLRGATAAHDISPVALWVAFATVALKATLAWWTRRRGRRDNNAALEALADDHASDLAASGAVAVGIFLARRGYHWVDPLAGAIVAVVIFRTGLMILRNSATELMDAVPSQALADRVRAVLAGTEGVVQIEEIHSHRFGPYYVVNLTIGLDGTRTIAEGDEICNRVEARIYGAMPEVRMVYVHYHPPRRGQGLSLLPRGRASEGRTRLRG